MRTVSALARPRFQLHFAQSSSANLRANNAIVLAAGLDRGQDKSCFALPEVVEFDEPSAMAEQQV